MTNEQLQFLIAQYADGTLPADQLAALEERLKTDIEAQAMLADERKLTAALQALPGPELAWGEVAKDFSAMVTGTVDEASRAADQKLNAILKAAGPVPSMNWAALAQHISQSIDAQMQAEDASDARLDEALRAAPLPEVNWNRLAQHISQSIDAEMQTADASDEKLDTILRAAAPLPHINWNRLAAHISQHVAETAAEEQAARTVVYRVSWVRRVSQLAVAACVLLATTIGILIYKNSGTTTTIVAGRSEVEVPLTEPAAGPAVAEVKIGPSASYVARNSGEDTFAARASIVIAVPARRADEFDRAGMFE
jgi:hypothetical protein